MADSIDRNTALDTVFDVMSDNKINHKHRALNRNIKQIPTVDTERHAHWIVVGGDLGYVDCKCSACGYTGCSDSALFDESELYNYCPDCGCKMDEVTNNDG